MTEALISQFLMIDGVVPSPGDRNVPRTRRALRTAPIRGPDDQTLHDALVRAFRQSVEQAVPSGLPREGAAGIEFDKLADAFADFVSGRSVLLQLKPDLAEGERSAVRNFLETLVRVSENLDESRFEATISKLADLMLPDDLSVARGALAADNLELRDRFISEVPQLTSAEIGAKAGLQTKNPYATAARWKKNGEIFSVLHRGTEYYPAFQFRDGRPHPAIKKVLKALPAHLSGWQKAFWFVSTNGWLGDKAPVDVLDNAKAVTEAAEHEGQEVVG